MPKAKEFHNASLSEIFEISTKLDTVEERINYLRNHKRADAILLILKFAYSKKWEADLPFGKTKYKPYIESFAAGMLYKQLRKLHLFAKNPDICQSNITPEKKLILWLDLLESIDKDDAEMMVLAKDGKLYKKFKRMTAKLAEEIFPETLYE